MTAVRAGDGRDQVGVHSENCEHCFQIDQSGNVLSLKIARQQSGQIITFQ